MARFTKKLTAFLKLLFLVVLMPVLAQPQDEEYLGGPPLGEVPLKVSIGFNLVNITDVSEKEETMDFEGAIYMFWKDRRWAHDPAEVGYAEGDFVPGDYTRAPRKISGASLLSPFDPVVWFRPRAKRLFDFEYRIEIYVPAAKRRWGYYVLPFRVGDKIVARVDLKADRKGARLLVQNAHLEETADMEETVTALASELQILAEWLELDDVKIVSANAFSKALALKL